MMQRQRSETLCGHHWTGRM